MRRELIITVGARADEIAKELVSSLPPELDSEVEISVREPTRAAGGADLTSIVALVAAGAPVAVSLIQGIVKLLRPDEVVRIKGKHGVVELPASATAEQIRAASESLDAEPRPKGKGGGRK